MVNPFVKDFAVHNVGLSKWQPALILSICSGIDIISRPLGGYICSSKFIREKLGTFETFTISVIGLGLVNLFAPFYVFNFASFAVYGVLFGLCFGYVKIYNQASLERPRPGRPRRSCPRISQ